MNDYQSPVGLVITSMRLTSDSSILPGSGDILNNLIDVFKSNIKTNALQIATRFVNSTRDITLSGLSAYSIAYYDYSSGNQKILDTMTISNGEFIVLHYYAEPGYFNKYAPMIMRMIESFQITNQF